MADGNIEIFAQLLVQWVRDQAIKNCKISLNPESNSPVAKRWIAELNRNSIEAVRDLIIPDCVDEAIFCLMNAIGNEDIRLLFVTSNGQFVNLTEEGHLEMAGRYVEEDEEGWRERYSKEKIVHYVK